MRAHTLGRWVGRLAAVAALGMGAILGSSVAVGADETSSSTAETAGEATTDSTDQSGSPDSYEWN
jgi:hypothetical protein